MALTVHCGFSKYEKRSVNKVSVFAIVGIMAIPALFVTQVPGCMRSQAGKSGRVINHDSGEGIDGITVVAEGYIEESNWAMGSKRCTYLDLVKTDSSGYYHLPSHFGHFEVGAPWSDPEHIWEISVGALGYVPSGTKLPLAWDVGGTLRSSIPHFIYRKAAVWDGVTVRVPDIGLTQLNMTFEQEVELFSYRGFTKFYDCDIGSADAVEAMKNGIRDFYKHEENYVCTAPGDATADATTASALYAFAARPENFRASLEHVVPNFISGGRGASHQIRLPDLCAAMRLGE